jgi:hypothetical protein
MTHALYVLRAVPGLASIKEPALCRALHLVSVFHATSAALKISLVVTNVLGFVVKCALRGYYFKSKTNCTVVRKYSLPKSM